MARAGELLKCAIFPFAGIFRAKRERDLHIETLAASVADEGDLPLAHATDRDLITSSQELEIDHVLQQLVDIPAKRTSRAARP